MKEPEAITIGPITPLSSWKLYDNPFYCRPINGLQHHHQAPSRRLHLLSARKLGASFWDLHPLPTFQTMDSEEVSRSHRRIKAIEASSLQSQLDEARSRIKELKALIQEVRVELERERKARKTMESLNKKLSKELSQAKVVIAENLAGIDRERKNREVMESVCDELAKEIADDKAEYERMRKEVEEERNMMRIAEVWREERVQMKLAEARFVMEEKLMDLERQRSELTTLTSNEVEKKIDCSSLGEEEDGGSGLCVTSGRNSTSAVQISSHRRVSADHAENPHIKRGIKGSVEFPKAVRSGGSGRKQLDSKLECQNAQLRLMMNQNNPNMAGVDNIVIR